MVEVARLNRLLLRAVANEPVTFGDLWPIANRLIGHADPMDSDGPGYRAADRFLQGARKKGHITFRRVGKSPLWEITPAGREALAAAEGRDA
jgi:hypothetical protein